MGKPVQPPAAAPPPLWLRAARMAVLDIVRLPIRVGLGLTCSARLVGEERIPLRGSVIVAPNHTSFADPVILQAFFPRHLTYLMTERYYRLPFLHQFFRFWGVVPLREGGWNREALRRAEEVLGAGRAVAIFPEGEISRDGLIHEARPGIATLARRSGAPILPVGIAGPERLLPPDTWRLHRARIALVVGELIPPQGLSREELTARVSEAIKSCGMAARQLAASS